MVRLQQYDVDWARLLAVNARMVALEMMISGAMGVMMGDEEEP